MVYSFLVFKTPFYFKVIVGKLNGRNNFRTSFYITFKSLIGKCKIE